MDLDEYQRVAWDLAIYPNKGCANFVYPVLGLCGESGEVAEKFKKLIRDHAGYLDFDFKTAISKELGDVLWYLGALCTELGLSLNTVAALNIEKLTSRKERNVLSGSGDDR